MTDELKTRRLRRRTAELYDRAGDLENAINRAALIDRNGPARVAPARAALGAVYATAKSVIGMPDKIRLNDEVLEKLSATVDAIEELTEATAAAGTGDGRAVALAAMRVRRRLAATARVITRVSLPS
jgi:hypothetical protein